MRLSSLFSNHAVLQRGKRLPVWGWCRPHQRVVGVLGGLVSHGLSDAEGRFTLWFEAQDHREAMTLDVKTLDGSESCSSHDLIWGNVWLGSGQSNMQWTLERSKTSKEELLALENVSWRWFKVASKVQAGFQHDPEGEWVLSSMGLHGSCSAFLAYFGAALASRDEFPVGVICSAWGGTPIESWLSRESLISLAFEKDGFERYEMKGSTEQHWQDLPKDGWENASENINVLSSPTYPSDPGFQHEEWLELNADLSVWNEMNCPGFWGEAGYEHSGALVFIKEIQLEEDFMDGDLVLELGAVDKHDITWFNGHEVGRTGSGHEEECWSECRRYTVPKNILKKGANRIAVRVYSFVNGGGLPGPAKLMKLTSASGQAISLVGSWALKVEHRQDKPVLPKKPLGVGNHLSPSILYNNMIHPLLPLSMEGVVWYQGESNGDQCDVYQELLMEWMRSWRYAFAQPDLRFQIVQLPRYKKAQVYNPESSWAKIREAQRQCALAAGLGLSVNIDLGLEHDVHPPEKRPFAERAFQSVRDLRQKPHECLNPQVHWEETKVRMVFETEGQQALSLQVEDEEPLWFVVLYSDGSHELVQGHLDGIEVEFSYPHKPQVESVALRYLWADYPVGAKLRHADGRWHSPFEVRRG